MSLANGLSGFWFPGLANTGTTIPDRSGRGHNATVQGGASAAWQTSPTAIRLTSDSDYLDCGNVVSAGANMTVACKVKALAAGAYQRLVSKTDNLATPGGWQLYYTNADKPAFRVDFAIYGYQIADAAITVTDWQTVAGRLVAATTMDVFVGGSEVASTLTGTVGTPDTVTESMFINRLNWGVDTFYYGNIDVSWFAVWTRNLSDAEILLLQNPYVLLDEVVGGGLLKLPLGLA